ncbi:H-NS family nucleoid-associated regulatory protein, partial [Burkholderia aenigmatica]
RCTTLSQGGSDLDEIGGLRLGGNQQPDQIFGRKRTRSGNGSQPATPKYQDPKTGKTWSGRGREPSWIKGKKRDRFLIAE